MNPASKIMSSVKLAQQQHHDVSTQSEPVSFKRETRVDATLWTTAPTLVSTSASAHIPIVSSQTVKTHKPTAAISSSTNGESTGGFSTKWIEEAEEIPFSVAAQSAELHPFDSLSVTQNRSSEKPDMPINQEQVTNLQPRCTPPPDSSLQQQRTRVNSSQQQQQPHQRQQELLLMPKSTSADSLTREIDAISSRVDELRQGFGSAQESMNALSSSLGDIGISTGIKTSSFRPVVDSKVDRRAMDATVAVLVTNLRWDRLFFFLCACMI